MTAVEMQYDFEIKTDTFHSVDKPWTSVDVAHFLNHAQDFYIDQRYSNKYRRDNYFEADEKIRTELGALIKVYEATGASLVSGSGVYATSRMVSMPSDYMYSLHELCTVSYSDCNNATATYNAKVLPMRHDEVNENEHNPYRKPYKKLVWRMDYGLTGSKKHELISGSDYTITSYKMRYLKRPRRIDIIGAVDCELHLNTHDEIVSLAVKMALSSKVPNQNNVEQKQEA